MSLFGDAISAFGGNILDMGMDVWKQDKAEDMQRTQIDFQREMSNTAYQRATKDLKAANLNPMLAYSQGGASTPSGGGGSAPGRVALGNQFHTAAQIQNLQSQNELNRELVATQKEEQELKRAQTEETRERAGTHAPNIVLTLQKVDESVAATEKLIQDARTGAASAENIRQQTANLVAEIPKIEAAARQLRVLADLNHAQIVQVVKQTDLTEEQIRDLQQKIDANLPEIERLLKDLQVPKQAAEANVYKMPILGELLTISKNLKDIADAIQGRRTTINRTEHNTILRTPRR